MGVLVEVWPTDSVATVKFEDLIRERIFSDFVKVMGLPLLSLIVVLNLSIICCQECPDLINRALK